MAEPRLLRQPGPARDPRIATHRGHLEVLRFPLRPGVTLNEALTEPLTRAGWQSASLRFAGAGLEPFRYVIPAPAPDTQHVAYFSDTHAPTGRVTIEQACATFGTSNGRPFTHCHAVWREADGSRRGGHILPLETIVTAPADVVAWGFRDIRIETGPDPETNFTLFQPSGGGVTGEGIVARVLPNQDILLAAERIAAEHGLRDATFQGSLGSLVGMTFADGTRVNDDATEVLVRAGHVRNGIAAINIQGVDMSGDVYEGWLERGQNPVCITFDLFLAAKAP